MTLAASAASVAVSSTASAAPTPADYFKRPHGKTAPETVPNSYIVTLKETASAAKANTVGSTIASKHGFKVKRAFTGGFSATMTAAQAKAVAKQTEVAAVRPERVFTKSDTQPAPPSWGLDRIDQPRLPLDNSYSYPAATSTTVTAYVIDSGIRITHPDFGGRASHGPDFVDNDSVSDDCHGHGTHVAGTLGGTSFGVAKRTNLVAVRVLDCSGKGTESSIAAAIDWVTANAVKPAVANLSLGSFVDPLDSSVVDTAVRNAIASGITVVVAAGNEYDDAAYYSPARIEEAVTVSATDQTDTRPIWANFGRGVDIFAPGVDVVSADIGGGSLAASGTSMASPHVAGGAALLLEQSPTLTPAQVRDNLLATANTGAVYNPGVRAVNNKLLNVNGTGGEVISLRGNNGSVVADNGTSLNANRVAAGPWEQYDVVSAGGGQVYLRSRRTGRYVTYDATTAAQLTPSVTTPTNREKFTLTRNPLTLQAANGKFVSTNGGTGPLVADRAAVGPWEVFTTVATPTTVLFLTYPLGEPHFVTAEGGGSQPLIANRPGAGGFGNWEQFEVIPLATAGHYGLRAKANGKFVCAEGGGSSPLIANRTTVGGTWEEFLLPDVDPSMPQYPGYVAIQSWANGRYATHTNSTTLPLITNRTAIGAWETMVMLGG
jgi:subtilisin family serine protease